jgi:hypothetical protein
MEIKIRSNDSLRVNAGADSVFADIQGDKENGQYILGVQFYDMHKLQLREKQGSFKMFAIPNEWSFSNVDFGWWEDADIVWERVRA